MGPLHLINLGTRVLILCFSWYKRFQRIDIICRTCPEDMTHTMTHTIRDLHLIARLMIDLTSDEECMIDMMIGSHHMSGKLTTMREHIAFSIGSDPTPTPPIHNFGI